MPLCFNQLEALDDDYSCTGGIVLIYVKMVFFREKDSPNGESSRNPDLNELERHIAQLNFATNDIKEKKERLNKSFESTDSKRNKDKPQFANILTDGLRLETSPRLCENENIHVKNGNVEQLELRFDPACIQEPSEIPPSPHVPISNVINNDDSGNVSQVVYSEAQEQVECMYKLDERDKASIIQSVEDFMIANMSNQGSLNGTEYERNLLQFLLFSIYELSHLDLSSRSNRDAVLRQLRQLSTNSSYDASASLLNIFERPRGDDSSQTNVGNRAPISNACNSEYGNLDSSDDAGEYGDSPPSASPSPKRGSRRSKCNAANSSSKTKKLNPALRFMNNEFQLVGDVDEGILPPFFPGPRSGIDESCDSSFDDDSSHGNHELGDFINASTNKTTQINPNSA